MSEIHFQQIAKLEPFRTDPVRPVSWVNGGVQAMRLVRRFEGHVDRITDLVVSEDCRWLISSSMDGTLRVWDIPASATLQVSLATKLQPSEGTPSSL